MNPATQKSFRSILWTVGYSALATLLALCCLFVPDSPLRTALVIASLAGLVATHFLQLHGKAKIHAKYDQLILQDHMAKCADSRQKTRDVLKANDGKTTGFALEMKDSVYMVTSIAGSSSLINRKIESLNTNLMSSSAAIEEISQTIAEFGRQIEHQTGSVVQTTAAVEQMDASINNVREITTRKKDSSRELLDLTETSRQQVAAMNTQIAKVTQGVDSVQGIIQVIDGIASQTNLLSMNAAIEAAHAGDSGRGFAVVAAEIRKLAESTGANATLISKNLKAIIADVGQVQQAGQTVHASFERISRGTREVVDSFSEIREATAELNIGSQEIVSASQTLSAITGHIREGSQEITLSVREIRDAIASVLAASSESTREIGKIAELAQDINVLFISLGNTIIEYETVKEQIRAFQDNEVGGVKSAFPVVRLILQHLLWVLRARGTLDGKLHLAAESIIDHHGCALGKWIDQQTDESLTRSAVFQEMNREHEKLHLTVKDIIAGKESLDKTMLEKKYHDLLGISENVIQKLMQVGALPT